MAMDVRVIMNGAGVRKALTDPKVRADLERRAGNIAAAAGPGMEVDSQTYSGRARASVRTTTARARRAEARDRALTRSLDAGRS
ncbi:hypothetical protein [Oerskovia jenensis]|uniref:hypothetical protein n=1 Tax=Oerskovia jenensis TaxID=162169 RepID=UPI0036D82B84